MLIVTIKDLTQKIRQLWLYFHYKRKYPIFVKAALADAKRFKKYEVTRQDIVGFGEQLDLFMKVQNDLEEKFPAVELVDIDELIKFKEK